MIPAWLHDLAIASLALGFAVALAIVLDELRHPQRMWIMNVVWPVTALFGTVVSLWGYVQYGRPAKREQGEGEREPGGAATEVPFPVMVAKSAAHCGAGCTLGDIAAEWLAFAVPGVAAWLGWRTLFSEKMFAVWILDFIFAFLIGIAFQYFTIKPMRDLSPSQGLVAAVKADSASLAAWQVGMYGFMAVAQFYIFRGVLGARLEVNSVEFWFMMQIAMLAGFGTSYPVNWWLLRAGLKEKM